MNDPASAPVPPGQSTLAGKIVCSPAGAWFAWGVLLGLTGMAVVVWVVRKKL